MNLATLASVLVLALAASAGGADGARQGPTAFTLVFVGTHNAALLHESPFRTSASFCLSGYAADTAIEADTETAVRTFQCSDSPDAFTARVRPVPAEHGGNGSWQIVSGTGALKDLRGKGTWTSVRLSGADDDPRSITFQSTWEGVTDFDASPPTVAAIKSTARKLRRPKGAYQLSFRVSFNEPAGNVVSYSLTVIDPRNRLQVSRSGETSTGTASVAIRVRPTKRTRVLTVKIEAADPLGNAARFTTTRRIR
jgi:hypothetical protein